MSLLGRRAMPGTLCLLGFICLLHTDSITSRAAEFNFFRDGVLGTSFELQLDLSPEQPADSAGSSSDAIGEELESHAAAVEAAVIAEIERLDRILSRYRADSELSRFVATKVGEVVEASTELTELLRLSEQWQTRTHGAFSPGIQLASDIWQAAAKRNRLPSRSELAEAVAASRPRSWRIVDSTHLQRTSQQPLVLDAIAKGAVIDRAVSVGLRDRRVRGIMVNIGGDLVVRGNFAKRVGIANPFDDADNAAPLARVTLQNRGLATSGNYRRGFQIGDQWYSHILDPSTGHPVDHIVSASVVAADAATADVLATALSVLPLATGLQLIRELPDVECLMVDREGRVHRSRGWSDGQRAATRFVESGLDEKPADPSDASAAAPADVTVDGTASAADQADRSDTSDTSNTSDRSDTSGTSGNGATSAQTAPAQEPGIEGFELLVEFEVNKPPRGGRWPYLAVWLEDQDGFPVRTLNLFVKSNGQGPRWHRELRRWYRSNQLRLVVDETDLIDTMSVATRPPGKYKVVWDGKDDAGALVKAGTYTLYLEVAREHGTYQLMKKELVLRGLAVQGELKGNVEIKQAAYNYRAKQAGRQ